MAKRVAGSEQAPKRNNKSPIFGNRYPSRYGTRPGNYMEPSWDNEKYQRQIDNQNGSSTYPEGSNEGQSGK